MTLVEQDASASPPERSRQRRSLVREVPFLLVVALVLALVIKAFLLQAFSIPSASMERTLHGCPTCQGDRVLVNKVVYDVRGIHRGDVVVFNGIDDWAPEGSVTEPSNPVLRGLEHVTNAFGITSGGQKDYIKRVIGLPGDRVMCCSPSGNVVVTPARGQPVELHEPYVYQPADEIDTTHYFCAAGTATQGPDPGACPPGAAGVLVPQGRIFVLGDHRTDSADSRDSQHRLDHEGTIPESKVVGRAFVVAYPVSHWRFLGTPSTFTAQALGAPGAAVGAGVLAGLPVVLLRRRSERRPWRRPRRWARRS